MRLLILTQAVDRNDPILGFFVRWVEEFAKQCESVIVICLWEGEHDLPENVRVLSLGKESGVGKPGQLFRFYQYIWRERKNYDAVFVHMNQIYVILGGVLWRLWGKKIGLWYAHGHVPLGLRIAEKLTHIAFTSTQSGFRLKSKKINVVGQGIDTDSFKRKTKKEKSSFLQLVTVGRISPVKNYETLIDSVSILKEEGIQTKLSIVGGLGAPDHESYLEALKRRVSSSGLSGQVSFLGPCLQGEIKQYLENADIFINTSLTGSLDKAILEAMALEVPILTCNEALVDVLGPYRSMLMYPPKNPDELARRVEALQNMSETEFQLLGQSLRKIVLENHTLESFIKKILHILQK